VCELLDRKLIKYVGLEIDPNKAIQARNKGLPVFFGDIGRQEVAEAFNVGKAKAVIVCIADKAMANRAVIALRRFYPKLKIFARAVDADHASRLQKTLDVAAMVPILPEDNLLLTLPFAGAVLKALGSPAEEVNAILEAKRKEVLSGRALQQDEEEMALLQLGIEPEEEKKSEQKINVQLVRSGPDDDDDEDFFEYVVEAAAERRAETKEKSPFVAQVIEEVCPDSAKTVIEVEPEEIVARPLEIIDVQIEPTNGANTAFSDRNSTDAELATPAPKDG
jgi:voltage-gated potassium channel Kch